MCQVVGCSKVAPDEPDIAIDNMLLDNLALSCDQLNANVQLGRPTHSSDSPSSLATRRIFLHCCLQNEEAGNIVRIAIPAAEQLFELLAAHTDSRVKSASPRTTLSDSMESKDSFVDAQNHDQIRGITC